LTHKLKGPRQKFSDWSVCRKFSVVN